MTIAFIYILSGCNKPEVKYSCNPKAHLYAIQNIEANQMISRDSLVKLEKDYQFAVWRSMSPENRKRNFDEKIDKVLAEETLTRTESDYLLT